MSLLCFEVANTELANNAPVSEESVLAEAALFSTVYGAAISNRLYTATIYCDTGRQSRLVGFNVSSLTGENLLQMFVLLADRKKKLIIIHLN